MITVFPARLVRTMDPAKPVAEAVAVRDGRVLGVGTPDELASWGPAEIDGTFADSVLLPGFVEAHSHILEGALWAFEYVGYFDRRGADGRVRKGCRTLDEVLACLQELNGGLDDPAQPLIVWGFDPIYFPGERLAARHLDTVSEHRSILVFHASGHLATVNTALMRAEGFAHGVEMEGVPLDADGCPVGELQEPAAMSLARQAITVLFGAMFEPAAVERLGQSALHAGCTTLTELGIVPVEDPASVDMWGRVVNGPDFPARVSVFYNPGFTSQAPDDAARFVVELAERSTERLRFGHVKMILDGSIQGFTARLNPPGYLGGQPNGIWLLTPERFGELLAAFHRAGVTVHTHCNGDEAVDLFLDSLEPALTTHPWLDHRHTVQHCQLTTAAQYRRMARLGMCANIFANHIYFWGDQHRDLTIGPDRAERMDACATAVREGVRFAIHSDAAVTPLGQLHTAWCAANRVTASGEVLGAHERIPVEAALRAVTVDAAYQLRMDHEIGTIEAGKRADLVALGDDPLAVDPMDLRNIEVRGTVLGGRPQPTG